jgi:ubiquinone/menaquinone biosynthesis C-methylase UbiE
MIDQLCNYFNHTHGGEILDVATGKGDFIPVLKTVFKSFDVIIGIDESNRELRKAASRFREKNILFVKQNSYQLDFPDQSFDHISMGNSLHHFNHVARCLNEICRVLKTTGKVIITEIFSDVPSPDQRAGITIHDFFAEIDRALGFEHHCVFSRREIFDLIRDSRLEPIHDFIAESHVRPTDNEAEQMTTLLEKRLQQLRSHADKSKFRHQAGQIRELINRAQMVPPTTLVIIAERR